MAITFGDQLLGAIGEDSTFTGRADIWPAVWRRIENALWLGHGYDAFWQKGNDDVFWLWYETNFEVYNSHNGWLESWLAIGIMGPILLAWIMMRMIVVGLTSLYVANDPRRVALPFAIMILAMSMGESVLGGPEGPAWMAFILIGTKAAMGPDRDLTRRRSGSSSQPEPRLQAISPREQPHVPQPSAWRPL